MQTPATVERTLLSLALWACASAALAQVDAFQPEVPAEAVATLNQARSLRQAKNQPGALALLQPLVQRQPDYFNAQYELGLVLSDNPDDIAKSIPALERAAAIKRKRPEVNDAHVFNSLGWAYMHNGQYARAEAVFKEAERQENQLQPDVKRRLFNNLGALYLATGRRTESEKYLRVAAEQYQSKQADYNLRTLESARRRDAAPR